MKQVSRGERGAALLAVLAMVMLLAGFASLGLARLRAATDRITDAESRADAHILAYSATSAALGLVQQLKAQARTRPGALQAPIRIPMQAGQVELRFSDGGNCYNLNSLVRPQAAASTGEMQAQSRAADFAKLLAAAGVPAIEASTVAQATATRLSQTGMLLADASEWVLVPGVTAKHWELAGPLLCALPNREATAININSLRADQAPLLAAMGMGADEARRALASRPPEGWSSAGDFWQQTSANSTPDSASADMLGVSSRWIALDVVARTANAAVGHQLLLDTSRQPARVASSRWTAVPQAVLEDGA